MTEKIWNLGKRFWVILAIITVSFILMASLLWIVDHPYGISWDEARYLNQVQADIAHSEAHGFRGFVRALLLEEREIPPAYRAFAIPYTYLFGFSAIAARLVSLALLAATLLFVYLGARSIAGPEAGAFSVIFLCLCPEIIFLSMVFGTEPPLYLATGATLCFVFLAWNRKQESSWNWIALGISLGLGALAKASFLFIGGPILLIAFFLSLRRVMASPSPIFFAKACALGTLIALPWWLLNFRYALSFVGLAANYVRHSLGPPGLETSMRFASSFAESALGLPLSILSVAMIVTFILRFTRGARKEISAKQKIAMAVCFLAPLPLIIAPLFTKNHNLNHISLDYA
ncbi:MAG: ArnT family glycosyltransferase [Syntrophobacteraceae bacterium]